MAKLIVKDGCIGCQACVASLTPEEAKIAEKYIKVGDDGLMHGTNTEIQGDAEMAVCKKMVEACVQLVLEIR